MTASASDIDGLTALSSSAASSYNDMAAIVRFNTNGFIDARDGGAYAPEAGIPYTPGTTYHVRLVVNVASRIYNIYVTPAGGSEITLGTNFAFRSSQSSVTSLANLGVTASTGSHQVCNFTLSDVPPQPGSIQVGPSSDSSFSGVPGGPFTPSTAVYTITNPGNASVQWGASESAAWLSLSSTGGTLAAGDSVQVAATITSSANTLAIGSYNAPITFTNLTNGLGSTTRNATLSVIDPTGQTASSISIHGITWTFSQPRTVGQYITGDWWVVGPVTISSVSPAPSGGRHGSMVNAPAMVQAYDSRVNSYNSSLLVSFPVTLQPGASLLSTQSLISENTCDVAGYCPQSGHAYMLKAEVLTVVSGPQPLDAFRPPYISTTKPVFTASQLQLNLLPRLPFNNKPDLTFWARAFDRPWNQNLGSNWTGRMSHAIENMPNYGREIGRMVGEGALLLTMNYTDQQMQDLLYGYVQLGIDLYYTVLAGASFYADGGHGNGGLTPITVAGVLLNHSGMKNLTQSRQDFGEIEHTYISPVNGKALWGQDCESPYFAAGCSGNGAKDCKAPSMLVDGCDGYRNCCTSPVWVAQALALRLFGAHNLWNHPAFFGYVDRWMTGDVPGGGGTDGTSFVGQMWNLYR